MRILYVTSVPLEYSSSANFRNIALIRGLIENGHSVSTLSTKMQESSECFDKTILDLDFEKRYFVDLTKFHETINASQKDSLKSKIKGVAYRIYTKLRLYDSRQSYASAVSRLNFNGERYDIVISSSDPKSSHLFVENLIKSYPGITEKWIQYWGDPFTGDINRRSFIPNFVVAKEEKRLLSLCDKAVYVSPLTSEYMKKSYPEYVSKICFVPIGYSEKKIYPKHESDKFDLCYCGDYYSKDRNLTPLIEATEHLKEICRLTIAGNSDLNVTTRGNITVFSRVEKRMVEEIEQNSDVIVCVCNRKGTQIPGKIYHASATNRIVLILLDGENQDKIHQYFDGYGRFVFAENKREKIVEVLQLLSQNKSEATPCDHLSGYGIAREIIK